jgi:hypothetical protein
MRFLTPIILLLTILITFATSSPITISSTPGGVYLCPGVNFSPSSTKTCTYHAPTTNPRGDCYTFPKGDWLQSIEPDRGRYCLFYKEADCSGDVRIIRLNGSTMEET